MRYRIRVTRLQVAERSVVGRDEDHALEKVSSELEQPFGFLGKWQTTNTDAESSQSNLETRLLPPFQVRDRC